jgi:hypothetical protein
MSLLRFFVAQRQHMLPADCLIGPEQTLQFIASSRMLPKTQRSERKRSRAKTSGSNQKTQ